MFFQVVALLLLTLLTKMSPLAEISPYNLEHSDQNYVASCNLPFAIVYCYQKPPLSAKIGQNGTAEKNPKSLEPFRLIGLNELSK